MGRELELSVEEINGYLARQLALAGDRRVASISKEESCPLVIRFENGFTLFIDSYGKDDGFCAQVLIRSSVDQEEVELL